MARPQAVIHPSTPQLDKPMQAYDPEVHGWTFSGTATAAADITNVKVSFGASPGGGGVGKPAAFHAADFSKGDTSSFRLSPASRRRRSRAPKPYLDFIDGTALAAWPIGAKR